jgi:hypothetical protein
MTKSLRDMVESEVYLVCKPCQLAESEVPHASLPECKLKVKRRCIYVLVPALRHIHPNTIHTLRLAFSLLNGSSPAQ